MLRRNYRCSDVGRNLKYIRNKNGLTLKQLSVKLSIPKSSVGYYESYGEISSWRLQMFADYYGIDVELFYIDHEQFKKSV